MEPVKESLVLGSIVGRWEVDLENILESLTSRGDEHYTSPRAFNHERAIKVHCLVFKLLGYGRSLGFGPLGYEVNERLVLDSRSSLEAELKRSKFHSPLCDPPDGITIVKNITDP